MRFSAPCLCKPIENRAFFVRCAVLSGVELFLAGIKRFSVFVWLLNYMRIEHLWSSTGRSCCEKCFFRFVWPLFFMWESCYEGLEMRLCFVEYREGRLQCIQEFGEPFDGIISCRFSECRTI